MNFSKYLSNIRDYDMDDALNVVGLQKHSRGDWVFPMLVGLGAGMAIGAGLVFFMTPYKGQEARQKVLKGADEARKAIGEKVGPYIDKIASLAEGESPVTGVAPVTGAGTPHLTGAASTGGNAPRMPSSTTNRNF